MKIFAVIDTNVLVSALLKYDSIPGIIVENAVTGKIIPVLSEKILGEYSEVLHREKFNFSSKDIHTVIYAFIQHGTFFTPSEIEEIIPDEKDIEFYAVTMEARKENTAYLITGNIRHFPVKPYIVTPREFLNILEKSGN